MRHPFTLAITATACAALLGAGCGGSSNSATSNSANEYRAASSSPAQSTPSAASTAAAGGTSGATVVGTVHTSLGTILVAGPKRLTVYLFAADRGPQSTCSGACAQVWPPVTTTGTPRATGGTLAADLGTTTRSDGTKQLTYKGHPLYYYASDQSSGETTGEGVNGFGAAWYVLNSQGHAVTGS